MAIITPFFRADGRILSAFLPYAVYAVRGDDAASFLQGQLTCDVCALVTGAWQLAGYCLPNGKVLAVFSIQKESDGFLLALPADLAEAVIRRLQMFVLRSKVTIVRCDAGLYALAEGGGAVLHMGARVPDEALDADGYFAARIRAGLAEIFTATSGVFLPQMLALPEVGAVSFSKGCYVGQEAVARLHYKGSNRRVLSCAQAALPDRVPIGADVFAGDLRAGTVLLAVPPLGLVQAVIQDRFLDSELFLAGWDVPLLFHHGEDLHGEI